jgi:hypothetical protein
MAWSMQGAFAQELIQHEGPKPVRTDRAVDQVIPPSSAPTDAATKGPDAVQRTNKGSVVTKQEGTGDQPDKIGMAGKEEHAKTPSGTKEVSDDKTGTDALPQQELQQSAVEMRETPKVPVFNVHGEEVTEPN